jgi:hypothetical protein
MTAQVSRFDIRTRSQAGWSGHLHDNWQRPEDGPRHAIDDAHYSKFSNSILGANSYLFVSGHNSEARYKALHLLYNPLQLERVGLAQTGFIRTKGPPPSENSCKNSSLSYKIERIIRYIMMTIDWINLDVL